MSNLTFAALRAGNTTRHVRYYAKDQPAWSHDEWMVAIGGEVGEALNLVKKINRVRQRMAGDRRTLPELTSMLGDELADVAIYDDIIASHYRTEQLGRAQAFRIADFAQLRNSTEQDHAFAEPDARCLSGPGRQMLRHLGVMADMAPLTNQQMAVQCDWLLGAADAVAWHAGIDLGAAVIRKFNATSEKLGFPERLGVWP